MSKMVKKFENLKKSEKVSNIFFKFDNFKEKKKYYYHSFSILEGRDLTRDLQSSPFQISGGFSDRDEGRRTKDGIPFV